MDASRRGPQTARNCSFRSSMEVELLSSSATYTLLDVPTMTERRLFSEPAWEDPL